MEFEAAKPGANASAEPFRRKSVTGGREAFGGANPIAVTVASQTQETVSFKQTTLKTEYKDFVGGNVLLHGKSTAFTQTISEEFAPKLGPGVVREKKTLDAQVYEPPFSFPIDMKTGQVVSQQSSVTKTRVVNGRSDQAVSVPATGEMTYHGRETLETPLGTFDTCKFSLKITIGNSVIGKEVSKEFWLAAEGPYRGQLLKGADPKSSTLVTKMTYSPK